MTSQSQYDDLLTKEARHWDSVTFDPGNPQIWHDEALFQIFFGKEYNEFLQRAASRGSPILELGCGEGRVALELAQRGCRVEGIDLSPERIQRARRRAAETSFSERLQFSVGDLNTISLPAEHYASVISHDALHHVLHLDRLLAEVRTCLIPGGAFLVMDYAGMGRFRKMLAAALFALLPTVQSYREKWQLRKRLRSFLASENEKRNAMEHGSTAALHPESPFEEISQSSILPSLRRHFHVIECRTSLPFWYYLAPKLRLSGRARTRVARILRRLDDMLSRLGVEGAYFFLEARKP